ncbi:MAG: multidrug effflux MFS transporter [Gammaproteobacteria bacterium]|nr:multidrug effflux MFS transporter [Gammaproteobacteria bacterium]
MQNFKSKHSIMIFPILLALYEVVTYLSNDAYLPALPQMTRDLHTTNHLAQLTLTMIFIGSASMQMILGPITDRIGRRPVLLIGGLIFILSTLGCSVTDSIYWLLLLRLIQGATVTSLVIAGYSTIHDLFDQKTAIHILAIMGSITLLAPAFGPLLGSIIMIFSSWRWIFGILAITAAFVIFGLYFTMPETVKLNSEKTKIKTTIIQYKNIFTNKLFMLYSLLFGFLFSAMIAWIVAGPFLLMDVFHFQPYVFGIAQACVFGSLIVGLRFIKLLMKKFSLEKITTLGVSLSFIGGIYALIASWLFPNVIWNIIISMMIIAGGASFVIPIVNRLAIESCSEPMSARVSIYSFLTGVFGIIGTATVSVFYNEKLFSLGLLIFIFSLIAVLIQYILVQDTKNRVEVQS